MYRGNRLANKCTINTTVLHTVKSPSPLPFFLWIFHYFQSGFCHFFCFCRSVWMTWNWNSAQACFFGVEQKDSLLALFSICYFPSKATIHNGRSSHPNEAKERPPGSENKQKRMSSKRESLRLNERNNRTNRLIFLSFWGADFTARALGRSYWGGLNRCSRRAEHDSSRISPFVRAGIFRVLLCTQRIWLERLCAKSSGDAVKQTDGSVKGTSPAANTAFW